jgi:hypothetical protein
MSARYGANHRRGRSAERQMWRGLQGPIGSLWGERYDFHADKRVGIQHRRAHERHRGNDALKHMSLQRIKKVSGLDRNGRLYPYRRVNNVVPLGAEMLQTTDQMLADNVELPLECRSKHRLAIFERHNSCNSREHEIRSAYAQRGAVGATKRIVPLNASSTN